MGGATDRSFFPSSNSLLMNEKTPNLGKVLRLPGPAQIHSFMLVNVPEHPLNKSGLKSLYRLNKERKQSLDNYSRAKEE